MACQLHTILVKHSKKREAIADVVKILTREGLMAIKSITIGNFKGIRDKVTIDLKPITLLFGKNSSGKSSIIHALHYAYEVIVRHNLDPNFTELGGKEVDLGGFENIVHGHDTNRSISLRFDLDLKGQELPIYYDPEFYRLSSDYDYETNIFRYNIEAERLYSGWVEIEISALEGMTKFYVSKYMVGLNEELIAVVEALPEADEAVIQHINFVHPLLRKRLGEGKELIENLLSESDVRNVLKEPGIFPSSVQERLINFLKYQEESQSIVREEHIKSVSDDKALSDEERRQKFKKLLEKLEALQSKFSITENDLIKEFEPYEFLIFSIAFLGLSSLKGDLKIPIGKGDALQNFDSRYGLGIEMRSLDYHGMEHWDWDREAVRCAISQFVLGPGRLLRDYLRQLHYLGPIRSRIPRNYEPNRYIENSRWADGTAAWDALHKESSDFVKKVDYWLRERLKSSYHIFRKSYKEIETSDTDGAHELDKIVVQRFAEAPVKTRLCLVEEDRDLEVQLSDVGTGISQVLPIVVAALYFDKGVISIEQPELHIHPAMQVELGDLFINEATSKDVTFLIETHSEHLLLRLLRRIRQTQEEELPAGSREFTPDNLAIYFIDKHDGKIVVSAIRIDQDGDFIDRWPRGFFTERAEELF